MASNWYFVIKCIEDQAHIVNCPEIKGDGDDVNIDVVYEEKCEMFREDLDEIYKRLERFDSY